MSLKVLRLKGGEIRPYVMELAKLRLAIFKEFPYLYEGSIEDELEYMKIYMHSPDSIMIVALDNQKAVGIATAMPLKQFTITECQKPFLDLSMNISDIFYFGESVLDKNYRGQGIYRQFFQEREAAAKAYGSHTVTFCAVERSKNHPHCPQNYRSLDKVWEHFGYKKHPEILTYFVWKDIGDKHKTAKPMIFWMKQL